MSQSAVQLEMREFQVTRTRRERRYRAVFSDAVGRPLCTQWVMTEEKAYRAYELGPFYPYKPRSP